MHALAMPHLRNRITRSRQPKCFDRRPWVSGYLFSLSIAGALTSIVLQKLRLKPIDEP
jgi:hypothetical protein